MVAEYLKGLDLYKCEIDGFVISEPFWHKCEHYKKDNFSGGFFKLLSDKFSYK